MLSAPMMHKGEVIGVVRVYSGEQREFNEDDTYFVQATAYLGAIALENARLYESVQKDRASLRRDMR